MGSIFVAAAALCIPALIALAFIGLMKSITLWRNAAKSKHAHKVARIVDLARNHGLVLFTAALVLFQLADASMLPLIGENLATTIPTNPRLGVGADYYPANRSSAFCTMGRLSLRKAQRSRYY